MALTVSAQNDCKGQVCAYSYNLTPLAQKLGLALLQADSSKIRTFSYSVCNNQTGCVNQYNSKATVCQWIPWPSTQWYRVNARIKPLVSGNDTKGFTLYIPNGVGWTMEDGEFSFVNVNYTGATTYNLQYMSKGNSCCLYQFKYDPSETKTLCSVECPQFFGGYWLYYNWTSSPCTSDTCFFHKTE